MRLSTRFLRRMKRERKLIKKEKDRYIDPENGSLPRRRSYGFVTQSFLSHKTRNEPLRMSAWEAKRMEEKGTRPRKSEEEKRMVQERWKRGGNLCTSYTEFTATEEIPERNKATKFQNQGGRKSWCCNQKVTPEV